MYALITAVIFLVLAIAHAWRIYQQWPVQIGPTTISMNVSWAGLVVAVVLSIWGFSQLGGARGRRAFNLHARQGSLDGWWARRAASLQPIASLGIAEDGPRLWMGCGDFQHQII